MQLEHANTIQYMFTVDQNLKLIQYVCKYTPAELSKYLYIIVYLSTHLQIIYVTNTVLYSIYNYSHWYQISL